MRVIVELPPLSEERTARACGVLMEAVARVALIVEEELGRPPDLHAVPGLRFQQEPFTDGEHFDLPWTVQKRGWMDCDDAAIWRLYELYRHGENGARARVVWRPKTRRYHAEVRRGDGSTEDRTRMIERVPNRR